jgi:hypothetical protein
MMLIYNFWQARNDARDTDRIEYLKTTVKKTTASDEEWMQIHDHAPAEQAKVMEALAC